LFVDIVFQTLAFWLILQAPFLVVLLSIALLRAKGFRGVKLNANYEHSDKRFGLEELNRFTIHGLLFPAIVYIIWIAKRTVNEMKGSSSIGASSASFGSQNVAIVVVLITTFLLLFVPSFLMWLATRKGRKLRLAEIDRDLEAARGDINKQRELNDLRQRVLENSAIPGWKSFAATLWAFFRPAVLILFFHAVPTWPNAVQSLSIVPEFLWQNVGQYANRAFI